MSRLHLFEAIIKYINKNWMRTWLSVIDKLVSTLCCHCPSPTPLHPSWFSPLWLFSCQSENNVGKLLAQHESTTCSGHVKIFLSLAKLLKSFSHCFLPAYLLLPFTSLRIAGNDRFFCTVCAKSLFKVQYFIHVSDELSRSF